MTDDQPMTEEEFLSIWQSHQQAEPAQLEYRLYYDENGFLLFFSTEDRPGNYVVVDQETYLHTSGQIRVVDGELTIKHIAYGKKLIPSDQGLPCDIRDVCVVVTEDQPHTRWYLKHEDAENE